MKSCELAAVAAEIRREACGAIVADAHQTGPLEIFIELRVPGKSLLLHLSASPDLSRAYLASSKPPNPKTPLNFQSLLRARITGERLTGAEPVEGDRVLAVRFTGDSEIVAELTGRHSNIFLVCGGVIAGSIRPNLSARRALLPGRPYVYPAPPPEGLRGPQAGEGAVSRVTSRDLERRYMELLGAAAIDSARQAAISSLSRRLSRIDRLVENLHGDLRATDKAPDYLILGETLKQNLSAIAKGSTSAVLPRYTESGVQEIEVELKPGLGPLGNMERFFRLAGRLSAARAGIEKRIASASAERERIAAATDAVRGAPDIFAIESAAASAGPDRQEPSRRRAAAAGREKRRPYTEYFIPGAGKILVGGEAAENDELTFRVARGNDLWFHVIGFPGAHVVAPLARGHEPSDRLVFAAARLAASRSRAPDGERVEVVWTRQKNLRKPRGAKPGSVLVTQEKRLLVTVEKGVFTEFIV